MQRHAHFCLNSGWPLGAQHLNGLEDVHHTLVPHPLQYNTEGDEHASPSYSSTVCTHIYNRNLELRRNSRSH